MNDSMTCGRCGRLLKDSKSKERGYGPICYKKVQEAKLDGTTDDNGTIQEDFKI